MNGAQIKNVAVPSDNADATTKAYVDNAILNAGLSGEGASLTDYSQIESLSGYPTEFLTSSDSIADATELGKSLITAEDNSVLAGAIDLGNVDNTADIDKPISNATQAALNLKANANNAVFTGTTTGITKDMVGLDKVDNTSDEDKPVSTATQSALDLKAPINNPTFTGTVGGINKSMVGLGNVDNTSDANKPVSTATQTALNAKANSSDLTALDTRVTTLENSTPSGLATVATSGQYNDLIGKPTLSTVATTGAYSDLSGKPSLSTVATSGAYSDLSGKPTLSTVASTGAYTDLIGIPTIPDSADDLGAVPQTRTVAGLPLNADITIEALLSAINLALGTVPIIVVWDGTAWPTYNPDSDRVRFFLSQDDPSATPPTSYNSNDIWFGTDS